MNEIVGIDLGTTNSLIGVMDAGFPILIADKNGFRLTPSVVHFPADGDPLVGQPATRMRVLKPAQTIYSIKRFIGLRGEELSEKDVDVSYRLDRKGGRPLRVVANGREFSPEEISALILGKLKADAEAALGHAISRAVMTVPAYFNDAQRNATKRAGELAGFSVERIVNEPTAAALAYGLDKLKTRARIAVFDLGGGTFDISILELNNGVFEVLATNGNTRLGGDDVDNAIMAHLGDVLRRNAPKTPRVFAKQRSMRNIAFRPTSTFRSISRSSRAAQNFSCELTREELEDLIRPIIEQTRGPCRRSLADAKLEAQRLGRSDSRRRDDADAAGPAIGRGHFWTRAQHIAKPGRSGGDRGDDPGGDFVRRGA